MSIKRIEPGKRMSGAVVHGNTVYLAGQVGEGSSVAEQSKSALAEVDRQHSERLTDGADETRGEEHAKHRTNQCGAGCASSLQLPAGPPRPVCAVPACSGRHP